MRSSMPAADPLALLVEGAYADVESGERLPPATRAVAIEDSLDGREAELLAALGLGPRLALVADPDTFAALGDRVARALEGRFSVDRVILDAKPRADTDTLARLQAAIDPRVDAVVAVGSGTVNDLSKLVALGLGRPQVVFATALSMNGYGSVSASITEAGFKRSVRARTPIGIFVDLGVVARAPARLVRAGLGDSICRPTAQADWLLAHLVFGRPYRETPFALLRDDEAALLADTAGLVQGDLAAHRALARTLVLSGFGMTIAGGSYPASQGEHLLSHYLEMTTPGPHALHGAQIGVAALAMAKLQATCLAGKDPPVFRASTVTEADVVAHFGPNLGAACWRELRPKLLDETRAAALTAEVAPRWDGIRGRIEAVTLGEERMRKALEDAGAPTRPEEVGWGVAELERAMAHAREVRDRYTFLDWVVDVG